MDYLPSLCVLRIRNVEKYTARVNSRVHFSQEIIFLMQVLVSSL